MDFKSWYESELRLMLQSAELTGELQSSVWVLYWRRVVLLEVRFMLQSTELTGGW